MSQTKLLGQRRFGPFFATQFLGAFNDNVFKHSINALFTFGAVSGMSPDLLVNLSAAIFILPFFLFSATSGQLADKIEKTRIIRGVKLLEIAIMVAAVAGFLTAHVTVLLVCLFMMGVHSTLFGPVKYSILPETLTENELVGGNALVETGTFLAILIGTLLGTLLGAKGELGIRIVCGLLVVLSVAGYLVSRAIPPAPPTEKGAASKIDWNPFRASLRTLTLAGENRTVFLSVLGISWFWFYGALFLAQLPLFAKNVLGGDELVVAALLATFSIGIGTGSMLCEKLSGGKIEIGLVPFGAFGLTLFGAGVFLFSPGADDVAARGEQVLEASAVLASGQAFGVLAMLLMLGMFGGFYIVPLFALVQKRSAPEHRSKIMAANNVLNALFMVAAAFIAVALRLAGATIPMLFLATALMNGAVAMFIFTLVPEFLMRFLVWMLVHTMYRMKAEGLEHIPDEGPAVLVCNHVSFVDSLVLSAACRRPIRFVMYHRIFAIPILSFVFRTARAIPIAPRHEDEKLMEKAFSDIAKALGDGELVCIFPEGKITFHGQMNEFKRGVERIVEATPAPVYPVALCGMWGSFFSRKRGRAMSSVPRRFWSKIAVRVGEPVAPDAAKADMLQEKVLALRGAWL